MWLKEWMKQHRFSQTQLSELLGIDRSTLNKIIHRRALPTFQQAKKIVDFTKGRVSFHEFFKDSEESENK